MLNRKGLVVIYLKKINKITVYAPGSLTAIKYHFMNLVLLYLKYPSCT